MTRRWCIFGEEVTPTTASLPREFVLLDNFYATGGNSGDGHQWVTQAYATDYLREVVRLRSDAATRTTAAIRSPTPARASSGT